MCTRIVYCWSESGQGPINQMKNIHLSNYEVSSLGLALYVQHLLLGHVSILHLKCYKNGTLDYMVPQSQQLTS